VAATHLFDIDNVHRHRVLVLEAGPLALPEHVQNLPPDLNPPGKGGPGSVRGQPWLSDSPMSFNQNFPGLAFCIGGRSVFWGGWSPYLIDSELSDPSWPASVRKDDAFSICVRVGKKFVEPAAASRNHGRMRVRYTAHDDSP
jgi:hypothetical protein